TSLHCYSFPCFVSSTSLVASSFPSLLFPFFFLTDPSPTETSTFPYTTLFRSHACDEAANNGGNLGRHVNAELAEDPDDQRRQADAGDTTDSTGGCGFVRNLGRQNVLHSALPLTGSAETNRKAPSGAFRVVCD